MNTTECDCDVLIVGAGPVGVTLGARGVAANRCIPLRVVDLAGEDRGAVYVEALVLVRPDQHVAWRGDRFELRPALLWDLVPGHSGSS